MVKVGNVAQELFNFPYCLLFRQLKRCLTEDVVKEITGDAHVIEELEKEWEQLQEDRQALRQVFPTGDSKVGAYYLFSEIFSRRRHLVFVL